MGGHVPGLIPRESRVCNSSVSENYDEDLNVFGLSLPEEFKTWDRTEWDQGRDIDTGFGNG